nr:DUF1194 domain-containing protein [Aminobacter sp. AP02]
MGVGAATFVALPAHSADVDVAIAFAVDVSSSVDASTADMQREGHAEALVAPEVLAAIARNYFGCVGITYFEWSSHGHLRNVLPWSTVCGLEDAKTAASIILKSGSPTGRVGGDTSISFAIDQGSLLLDQFPGAATRKIIDISANGTNNDGLPVQQSRTQAIAKWYTINAIAVSPRLRGVKYELASYFVANVIGGPNAFVLTPAAKGDYATALRRKLVGEISLSISRWEVDGAIYNYRQFSIE